MNNGTIKSAAQTFAQLQRVAGIALLLGPLRLAPDLMRIELALVPDGAVRRPLSRRLTFRLA